MQKWIQSENDNGDAVIKLMSKIRAILEKNVSGLPKVFGIFVKFFILLQSSFKDNCELLQASKFFVKE